MPRISYLFFYLLFALLPATAIASQPTCLGANGWVGQTNPPTDPTGFVNLNFPEASSTTYWGSELFGTTGTTVTVHGQYPLARFMALELYTGDTLVDFVNDASIQPDPGQNNPFVSGTTNGTYTAYVVFGPKPVTPAPNTIYTGQLTSIRFIYRIYHATDPNDPSGGATHPVLPQITLNNALLVNCPVEPYLPALSTPWLRLAAGDWIGTPPAGGQILQVNNPAPWIVVNPGSAHFFPNGADYYITTLLSRQYLAPYTANQVYVVRFLAPTFPNTRAGQPVSTNAQVRFWSFCTDDPYTTGVNRCIPDDGSAVNSNGYVTYVISDPSYAPTPASLTTFSAQWLAWGALFSSADVVYDRSGKAWGTNTPVHYYNRLLYRQTLANASFTQSFANVYSLPYAQQAAAMGAYWPVSGYCTLAAFQSQGAGCIKR